MREHLKNLVNSAERIGDTTFWFVRHGQSEGNVLENCPVMHDMPLTEEGRKEALRIATYFKEHHVKVDGIYTSPLGRTRETAEIIAKELGVPLVVKEGLHERHWGEFEGLCWTKLSKKLDPLTLEERRTFIPKDGESWQQMETRVLNTLEEVFHESAGGNILIVTHRGALRATLPLLAKAGHGKHEEFSMPTGGLARFTVHKDDSTGDDDTTFNFVDLSQSV